jgi:uncharacterized membrane protein YjgN (DUF898 family)
MHMGTSDLVFLIKINCIYDYKKSLVATYLPHKRAKKSRSNNLYFGLHKNDKRIDLSMCIQIYKFLLYFIILM